jgi:hypothetical protein
VDFSQRLSEGGEKKKVVENIYIYIYKRGQVAHFFFFLAICWRIIWSIIDPAPSFDLVVLFKIQAHFSS